MIIMTTLIDYYGVIITLLGAFSCLVFFLFYGLWKPYIKKIRLSQREFRKAIRLVAGSAFISGFGIMVIFLSDPQTLSNILSDAAWFPVIVLMILCLGLYPLALLGLFILHMRSEGFVRTEHKENDKKS